LRRLIGTNCTTCILSPQFLSQSFPSEIAPIALRAAGASRVYLRE